MDGTREEKGRFVDFFYSVEDERGKVDVSDRRRR